MKSFPSMAKQLAGFASRTECISCKFTRLAIWCRVTNLPLPCICSTVSLVINSVLPIHSWSDSGYAFVPLEFVVLVVFALLFTTEQGQFSAIVMLFVQQE